MKIASYLMWTSPQTNYLLLMSRLLFLGSASFPSQTVFRAKLSFFCFNFLRLQRFHLGFSRLALDFFERSLNKIHLAD